MATFYESSDPDLAVRLAADADLVKAALADTLARNHPDNVGDIELGEYKRAREFLANFGQRAISLFGGNARGNKKQARRRIDSARAT